MAIETMKDSICINQIIGQKNESIIVEGDSIIPDIKPDILSAISTSGTVCIYKKEILEGKIRIDGSINTYIIYLADDEESAVRSINTCIDFTQLVDLERARPDMMLDTNITLKNIECRVINGRKVNIKAILDMDLRVSTNENVDIVEKVSLKDIQMLNKNLTINSLIGRGETKVYAKDTLVLDNIDNLTEVMKTDIRITNKDIKISYNKVLAKADMNVKILYLTEENRINFVEGTIPVMGFIDIQDIADENICDVRYEVKNLIVKPNNVEEHSVYVEAELQIYCKAYNNQEINLIQDMYSPSTNIIFTKRQINVLNKKESVQNIHHIRETQIIPELQGNKIYDVRIETEIQKQMLLNDRIMYEGEVKLHFMYETFNNGIDLKIINIPFNFNVDFEGVNSNMAVDTLLEIGLQDFIVTSNDRVEIKIDLIFNSSLSRNTEISIIDDITEDEYKKIITHSMTVYYVKPSDTLWKIAKRFGSTVDEIMRVNGIEQVDRLSVGEQLFIPRYNG